MHSTSQSLAHTYLSLHIPGPQIPCPQIPCPQITWPTHTWPTHTLAHTYLGQQIPGPHTPWTAHNLVNKYLVPHIYWPTHTPWSTHTFGSYLLAKHFKIPAAEARLVSDTGCMASTRPIDHFCTEPLAGSWNKNQGVKYFCPLKFLNDSIPFCGTTESDRST